MGFLSGLLRQAGPAAEMIAQHKATSKAEAERLARQKIMDQRYEREQARADLAQELAMAQAQQRMGQEKQAYAAEAAKAARPDASFDMVNGRVANVETPQPPDYAVSNGQYTPAVT